MDGKAGFQFVIAIEWIALHEDFMPAKASERLKIKK